MTVRSSLVRVLLLLGACATFGSSIACGGEASSDIEASRGAVVADEYADVVSKGKIVETVRMI